MLLQTCFRSVTKASSMSTSQNARAKNSTRGSRPRSFGVESLEQRTLLSTSLQSAALTDALKTTVAHTDFTVTYDSQTATSSAASSSLPAGFSPEQIRTAYDFNGAIISRHGKLYVASGYQETIAIIDAYSDPDIVNDVETFDSTFGLSNY